LPHPVPPSFPTRRSSDLLKCIPLVFAGWIRYLMAVDDNGNKFDLSPDPLLETVCPYAASVRLGDGTDAEKAEDLLTPLLTDKEIDRKSTRLNSSHVSISY